MVEYVTKGLELNGSEIVLDLYAGVGTFTMRLAMLTKYVTAVESSHISVKAGRANANINNLRNVRYEEAEVEEFLSAFQGRADIVVVDPPRAGLDKKVCNEILKLAPQKLHTSLATQQHLQEIWRYSKKNTKYSPSSRSICSHRHIMWKMLY